MLSLKRVPFQIIRPVVCENAFFQLNLDRGCAAAPRFSSQRCRKGHSPSGTACTAIYIVNPKSALVNEADCIEWNNSLDFIQETRKEASVTVSERPYIFFLSLNIPAWCEERAWRMSVMEDGLATDGR